MRLPVYSTQVHSHSPPSFVSYVSIAERKFPPSALHPNKKQAEQEAAMRALEELRPVQSCNTQDKQLLASLLQRQTTVILLAAELWHIIISNLSIPDILRLGNTSLFLYQLTSDNRHWQHIYSHLDSTTPSLKAAVLDYNKKKHTITYVRNVKRCEGCNIPYKKPRKCYACGAGFCQSCWVEHECEFQTKTECSRCEVYSRTTECYGCVQEFCSRCWEGHDCPNLRTE